MAEVHVLDHPLIQHKLAILRSKDTPVKELSLIHISEPTRPY